MTDMTDLERLIAIEDIKRLKARRDRAVDTKDWTTYRALHVDEHVSHNEGFPRYEGADIMIENVRQQLGPDKISVHHSHTPDISFQSATDATGIWGMEDMIYWQDNGEERWLHGFGFYHERYVKRDGQWLFCFRQLKRIHVRTSPGTTPIGTLSAQPG